MKLKELFLIGTIAGIASCTRQDMPVPNEDASTFTLISSTSIVGEGAAEISAFDPATKRLFVTNNGSFQIEVFDLSNPALPVFLTAINISTYGGGVQSVDVNDGKLAAAISGFAKTDNGKVVIFKTDDYSVVNQIVVGALPDMVKYSGDGKYIVTANEGEPSGDYMIDPVGSISIIRVFQNYAVTTIDFSGFASEEAKLKAKGFRRFGPNASFAQDIEPEYVTISANSRTAWVSLQENNAIAEVNLPAGKINKIMPLGFKDHSLAKFALDPSDRDGGIFQNPWPLHGMYLPDAIAVYEKSGTPYIFSANEGDSRDYPPFYSEEARIKDIKLDPTVFPAFATLRTDAKLGRLKITKTLGDTDNDGDYDALYSFGGRSFSVWNGNNGEQVFDSETELEDKCIASGYYDDGRSDDKGVEPESMTIGNVGNKAIAFVGMERSNAIAIYNINNPASPSFIKLLQTGVGPEGLLFIPSTESPSGKSLLIVSCEVDGTVKVYQVN